MFFIPFPFIVAELVIFFWAVQEWGFFTTVGYYLLPCLLGFLILSSIGRSAVSLFQTSVMRGSVPGNKILNSGAIFVSGLLFAVPSFFTRVLAVLLLLPGTRHLLVWRFKLFMAQKIAQRSAKVFNFGMGGAAGSSGFKYYQYNGNPENPFESSQGEERDVTASKAVLDIKPIEIVHENNSTKKE